MQSSGTTAYLFPGQGSQSVGMGRALAEAEPQARTLWEEADQVLDFSLSGLAFEGTEAELQRTENAQPALLAASIASLRVLQSRGVLAPASYLAGHSLGEYTALVAAESLQFADAVRLVRRRGELMAREGDRVGVAMAAIIGLPPETVSELAAASGAQVANRNSPEQTVISGEADAVERASAALREAGARRVLPLSVSGAFHSSLMRPLADEFAEVAARVEMRPPVLPVVSNVSARPLLTEAEVRRELVEQLYSPVNWTQTLYYLQGEGVDSFVEIGPGKVLAGLVKRTLPGATVTGSDSLQAVVAR
ncbi:MAG: ACP S-malonyltransferase [Chloroflexota bacterium]|nr:ACP S-malonyltransferase [Chloroflexota bacterium]